MNFIKFCELHKKCESQQILRISPKCEILIYGDDPSVIQFANENIQDNDGYLYKTMTEAPLLQDFRRTAAEATRGCIVLERPDLLKEIVERHGATDTTIRNTATVELDGLQSRPSQYNPGNEIPEENWIYRFAKKHWFFGFGAYS